MGLISQLFGRNETAAAVQPKQTVIAVGAGDEKDQKTVQSFRNSNFTALPMSGLLIARYHRWL